MESIARKLNISKPAIYYHFENKKELYLQVLEKSFQDLLGLIEKKTSRVRSSQEKFSRSIQAYLEFGAREKNLIRAMLLKMPGGDIEITDYAAKLRKRVNDCFQDLLKKVFKKKAISGNSLKFVTLTFLAMMDRMILEAAWSGKKLDVKKGTFQVSQAVNSIFKVEANRYIKQKTNSFLRSPGVLAGGDAVGAAVAYLAYAYMSKKWPF
jgi:AcrR family transcriptional regulator